jgi:hypothetical protein
MRTQTSPSPSDSFSTCTTLAGNAESSTRGAPSSICSTKRASSRWAAPRLAASALSGTCGIEKVGTSRGNGA